MEKQKSRIINREQLLDSNLNSAISNKRQIVIELLEEGINAANPTAATMKILKFRNNILQIENTYMYRLDKKAKIIVVGSGKASVGMAVGIENILKETITIGCIAVPEKQTQINLNKIEQIVGGHPLVNQGSIEAGKKIESILKNLSEKDLVICLISGGGSALLEIPLEGVTIKHLQELFTLLTKNGATIHEINCIRKHFSLIKGGKLAQLAHPATVISLILSDVVGDNIETIASGLTAPDNTSWNDVKRIINKYKLKNHLPPEILDIIDMGVKGKIEETLKSNNPAFQKVINIVIASNKKSCIAIKELALQKGLNPTILTTKLNGEAKIRGVEFVEWLHNQPEGTVLIAGGETTVKLSGKGLGGRNQELILAATSELRKTGIILAAIGTDGKDGPTDAAGAITDNEILFQTLKSKLNIKEFLENNDSYNFFKKVNGLLFTGLTGTNVMDIIVGIK